MSMSESEKCVCVGLGGAASELERVDLFEFVLSSTSEAARDIASSKFSSDQPNDTLPLAKDKGCLS